LEENEVNSTSPVKVKVVRIEAGGQPGPEATLFTVCTDQSGLIGLLRHLHGRGLVLLSLNFELNSVEKMP
jgi:hypothetical protein